MRVAVPPAYDELVLPRIEPPSPNVATPPWCGAMQYPAVRSAGCRPWTRSNVAKKWRRLAARLHAAPMMPLILPPVVMCPECRRPMDGSSCTFEATLPQPADGPCDDCGVCPGGLHHHGCCAATCRVCDEQYFGCDHCNWWLPDEDPGMRSEGA